MKEERTKQDILITGGNGFLGRAIVEELLMNTDILKPGLIKIFDNNKNSFPAESGIEYFQGDVRNYEDVLAACMGIDVVFHTAAIVDWGILPESEVLAINVGGTENVIKACEESKVEVLVFTSSLDAVYSGKPLVNINENQPYPDKHKTSYCKSKYLGEKKILEIPKGSLKTCILRPSDIYGERDPYHIDALVEMSKNGFYVRLGNGKSKCQHVYVGNMAHAHLLAAKALIENNERVNGSIYFITDGPGGNFFKFFDAIVEAAGYRIWPKNLWLPKPLAYSMGSISEFVAFLMRPIKHYVPKFSRFAVTYTCTDFTFNSEKAKRDFGFIPKYSAKEAFERTVAYFRKDK
jgi:nucleoside-diphosphate-sugar epimerase